MRYFFHLSVLSSRTGWPVLFFLTVLLFISAPLSAQDAEDEFDAETEEFEEEDWEEEEEAEEEKQEDGTGPSAIVSPEQTEPAEQQAAASAEAQARPHGVLLLFPFTASYAEHVYISDKE